MDGFAWIFVYKENYYYVSVDFPLHRPIVDRTKVIYYIQGISVSSESSYK